MNGYSLIFAVVVILAVAVVSGAIVIALLGGVQFLSQPLRQHRRSRHPFRVH